MAISTQMEALGKVRSAIRDLFEYGNKRRAAIGAENVYDYSLGNPSVPPPDQVRETMEELLRETGSKPVDSMRDTDKTADPQLYDAGDIDSWALDALKWAVGAGVLDTGSATALKPREVTNRAILASVLMNLGK